MVEIYTFYTLKFQQLQILIKSIFVTIINKWWVYASQCNEYSRKNKRNKNFRKYSVQSTKNIIRLRNQGGTRARYPD